MTIPQSDLAASSGTHSCRSVGHRTGNTDLGRVSVMGRTDQQAGRLVKTEGGVYSSLPEAELRALPTIPSRSSE